MMMLVEMIWCYMCFCYFFGGGGGGGERERAYRSILMVQLRRRETGLFVIVLLSLC
jgi:hypothetical protein